MIKHNFITIDEGLAQLMRIDEVNPENSWVVPTGHEAARDMQLIGDGRLLVGHHNGYSEFDIATGKLLFDCNKYEGVTAARRQPNGRTILAGVDFAGFEGAAILELDSEGKEIRSVQYEGDYVRLIRQTPQGTILMSCNDRIREGDLEGNYLRDYPVEGFLHAWKALRLPNGNLLISAGYGAFMIELDSGGKIVRKFGGKEDVPESVNPFFYATFQLMPNGHIILANWQGHGPEMGESGIQLLEFDVEEKIVWQWSESERISSLQGLLVLDGLDISKLHDEREGIMKPIF